MGATCDTICSRKASINQTQPNTHRMKSRNNQLLTPSHSNQSSIPPTPDGITRSPNLNEQPNIKPLYNYNITNEGNIHQSLRQEFHEAIKDGNDSMVTFYLEDNTSMNLLNTPFSNNDTPLHTAVKYKQYNILEKLLEEGSIVNTQNRLTGNTSLHIAVNQNDIKSVRLLLKYGANAYINNINEETALSIAQRYKYKDILNEFGEDSKWSETDDYDEDIDTVSELPLLSDKNVNTQKLNRVIGSIITKSPDLNMPSNEEMLEAYDTERLGDISSELFKDITLRIKDNRFKLVELNGWLLKKQSSVPYSWLKRWVIIEHGYILWSDRQMTIGQNGINNKEKIRWNKCIRLTKISNIQIIKSKSEKKFKMSVEKQRDYIWKCDSKQIRDKWIDGLKQHIEHYKMESAYSSNCM
eukprot:33248_1